MTPPGPRVGGVLAAAVAAVVAVGTGAACSAPGGARTTLDVLAASSLRDAFGALGRDYEGRQPGVRVRFEFQGSSALARDIDDGVPADVYASADEVTMAAVARAGEALAPKVFARNRPEIIVAPGNPLGVHGPADLGRPGVTLALCAPEVPCGRLASLALAAAGVAVRPASLEPDAKAVVAKVSLGEADAGVVYVTDVRAAAGRADGVDMRLGDAAPIAAYPMAILRRAAHPAEARRWVDFALSADGQRTLARFGFLPP